MNLLTSIIDNSKLMVKINDLTVLIATGINFSLSNKSVLSISDQNFNLESQYMGFSIKDINHLLNSNIDVLLGSNILSKFNYKIDTIKNEFLLSSSEILGSGINIPVKFDLDIPQISVQIDNKQVNASIDTLSNYCYLNEKFFSNKESLGENDDFIPGMGSFSTKIYNVDFLIGNKFFSLKTGYYPNVIQKLKLLSTDKGVLGYEIIRNSRIVINSTKKELIYELP
jgi:hypothetical protein